MRSHPPVHRALRGGVLAVLVGLLGLAGALVPARAATPNDPAFSQLQWAPQAIKAPQAWDRLTGVGVLIGVVDSGVVANHEDLYGRIVQTANCIGSEGDAGRCAGAGTDDHGHGTHVSGIAAAGTDNGRGIAGIAPGASLVVARALRDADGLPGGTAIGDTADISAGIRWVVDRGAKVVNLSVGEIGVSSEGGSLRPALDYAWSKGAIPVLSAGNTQVLGFGSNEYGDVPAVVVGATARDGTAASYSSPTGNAKWAVMAPGGDGTTVARSEEQEVISTWLLDEEGKSTYAYKRGTSMAAPHVAGVLALLLSHPGMTPERAVEILLSTATSRETACSENSPTCTGLVDAAAAAQATGAPVVATTTTTTSTTTTVRRSTTSAPTRSASSPTSAPPATAPGIVLEPPPSSTDTTLPPAGPPATVGTPEPVPGDPTDDDDDVTSSLRDDGGGGDGTAGWAAVAGLLVLAVGGWAGWLSRRDALGALPVGLVQRLRPTPGAGR